MKELTCNSILPQRIVAGFSISFKRNDIKMIARIEMCQVVKGGCMTGPTQLLGDATRDAMATQNHYTRCHMQGLGNAQPLDRQRLQLVHLRRVRTT